MAWEKKCAKMRTNMFCTQDFDRSTHARRYHYEYDGSSDLSALSAIWDVLISAPPPPSRMFAATDISEGRAAFFSIDVKTSGPNLN